VSIVEQLVRVIMELEYKRLRLAMDEIRFVPMFNPMVVSTVNLVTSTNIRLAP
jgi:hypothetical protein